MSRVRVAAPRGDGAWMQHVERLPDELLQCILSRVERDKRRLALQLCLQPATADIGLETARWEAIAALVRCDAYFARAARAARDALYQYHAYHARDARWERALLRLEEVLDRFLGAVA